MLIFVLLAVLFATLLVVAYLLFIWWLDRYEREPLWVVGLTFLWGALGGTCLSCIINSSTGAMLGSIFSAGAAQTLTTVVVAPLVEEVMKGMVFVVLLGVGNQIDNKTDGLIYGAATGLGFACLENLFYYVNNFDASAPESLLGIIFLRTMFTALVHCVSSALLGMAIGHVRHRSGMARWLVWPLCGYLAAVSNHAMWNGMATLSQAFSKEGGGLGALTLLFSCLLVVCASVMMFILTQVSLNAEHNVIKRYLQEEAGRGVLPETHAQIIPYWSKRRKSGWLAPHIPKARYVRSATLLAFRHHQLDLAQGERKHQYMEDITRLRKEVYAYNHAPKQG